MIEKRVELGATLGKTGEPVLQMISRFGDMVKVASAVTDTMRQFIGAIDRSKNCSHVLCVGLGASEFWGPNVNGEWFPKHYLDYSGPEYGHRTFTTLPAHFFRQHANKDPDKALGPVVFSTYNPAMERVDLIFRVDRDKAIDLGAEQTVARIDAGDPIPVSMGCRVPFDECNICGSKHKKITEYCEHARDQVLNVLDDGRQVVIINHRPKFFDISEVGYGADRIAWTLQKVASIGPRRSYELAEMFKVAGPKTAEIVKQITGTAVGPPLVDNEVKELLAHGNLRDILRTSQFMGAPLLPREFSSLCTQRPIEVIIIKSSPRAVTSGKVLSDPRVLEILGKLLGRGKALANSRMTKKAHLGLPNHDPFRHNLDELGLLQPAYNEYVGCVADTIVGNLFYEQR